METRKKSFKFRLLTLLRNIILTIIILLPLVGMLLVHDARMASFSKDKKPWVHWNGLDPTTQVYVSWETENKLSSYIEYGVDSTILDIKLSNSSATTFHRFLLSDLSANMRYYYRVSHDQGSTWYASGTFKTAPTSAGSEDFSFAIMSDTQNFMGLGHYPRLCQAMVAMDDLSFVAYAGDMAQDHGQTSIITPDSEQVTWNQFWYETNIFSAKYPIVPNPGNHDDANEPFASNYYQRYFGVPIGPNHNYYSFNWGRTQFVMAQIADGGDEGRNNDSTVPTFEQDIWINNTLAAGQSMDFRIMIFHRALYSVYDNENDASLISRFMPILIKYNVSLLLYGHEHDYERYYIQNQTLICLGGGGSIMNDHANYQEGQQMQSLSPSFLKITCNSTGITLCAMTPTFNVIENAYLTKVGSQVVPNWVK